MSQAARPTGVAAAAAKLWPLEMRTHRLVRLFMRVLLAACFISPLRAMTFTLVAPIDLSGSGPRPNHLILASGPIEPGDTQRFEVFLARLPPTDIAEVHWGIALISPGGALQAGGRPGAAFRAHVVTAIALNGPACESACAVSLRGAAQDATAEGGMRLLQPGGRLGFHGIALAAEAVASAYDSLDLARLTNAVIRDYAIRMGGADDGLVQNLFNTPPEEMEYVDTPFERLGPRVTLAVDLIRPPTDWALNLCRHSVAGRLQVLDPLGLDDRVSGGPAKIGTVEAFRRRLLAAKHNDGTALGAELYPALAFAPAATAIDLLAGQPLYLDRDPPDIWEVGLGRGAGFFFDSCFAVAGLLSVTTVVVDGIGEVARAEN